ncbi:hypothetical protein H072_9978 [Dactylellina haptotyla CBS 200.50]|uniref:Uncharacterized protein n=1 Tax=Dactylellina haptotyla (strain CBS 200.50) TaxID=1284197 RepID=S8A1B9_DACHA|nr:hypothetical protein H072_9978 [Dactylellina haptotyla CBS 200.50]
MTDSDEKAEKLAAARKRFEELKRKKQPGKKAANTPQKGVNEIDSTATSEKITDSISADASESITKAPGPSSSGDPAVVSDETPVRHETVPVEEIPPLFKQDTFEESNTHGRITTSAVESQPEFGIPGNDGLLETLPEIYRKQASVIDELRAEKLQLLDEIRILRVKAEGTGKLMVERDKTIEDMAAMSEELDSLKEKIGLEQATSREGVGEKAEAVSLSRQISHLQSQLAQREKTILEIRRGSDLSLPPRLEENLRMKEEQLEGMSVELSELHAALETSVSSSTQLTQERNALTEQLKSMETELGEVKSSAAILERKLSHATDSLATDSAKSSAYETKYRAQDETISNLKKRVAELLKTIDHLTSSNHEFQATQKDSDTRCRELEKRLHIAQRENAGMQVRLAELKSSVLRNPRGVGHQNTPLGKKPPTDLVDEDCTGSFLDVDLLPSVNTNISQASPILVDGINETRRLPYDSPQTKERYHERQVLSNQIREELESWRGYKLNIVDIYSAQSDIYSRVFNI